MFYYWLRDLLTDDRLPPFLWIPVDESSDSGSRWSSSVSGPDVFGYWRKPYFPSLARCSQLATGSGNFLCSWAFFFLLQYPFLFSAYSPQTQKQMMYVRDTSCRAGFVVFGISMINSFFYLTFIPSCTQDGPTYIQFFFSPRQIKCIVVSALCISNFCCLALNFPLQALQHSVVSQTRPYRGNFASS